VDYFRALEIRALRAVEERDGEWFYRYVCRWYSKTFSTPLADVYSIADDDLFQVYFEEKFESMALSDDDADAERLKEIKQSLLETNEEKFERELAEAAGHAEQEVAHLQDQEMARLAWERKKAEDAKKPKTIQELNIPKIERPIMEPTIDKVPPVLNVPPDIKMNFVDDSEFERLVDELDGLGKRK